MHVPDSTELRYQPLIAKMTDEWSAEAQDQGLDSPDRRDGSVYCYDGELHLSVELALSTGRPLLLRGDPGSGKSSLAAYIARNLGWRYYEHVVTSATQAQDLLWRYDAVRRLADAQAKPDGELNDFDYVEPGVLWWVFDAETARRRGAPPSAPAAAEAVEPNRELNDQRIQDRAVVLIDELDKADPDVPNALLVPLGSTRFRVDDVSVDVARAPDPAAPDQLSRLLVVITTNEERALPSALLRRCVVHKLVHPDAVRLVEIARRHFEPPDQPFSQGDLELCRSIASQVEELRKTAIAAARRPPSTAEYLDAVRACRTLHIEVGPSMAWKALEKALLRKDDENLP
jgi:MoxR-like ATPase